MHTPNSLSMDPRTSVAFIITHTIKAGEEERYEAWLMEMLSAVSRAPGYLGREVFRPAQGRRTYTSIVRFDTSDHLHAWAASEARHALVSRVSDLLTKGDVHEIRTGMDFWFTPE